MNSTDIWSCQFSSAQETGNLFLTQFIFQLKITTLISWKCSLFKFFCLYFRVKKGPVGKKLKLWSTIIFLRSDLFAFFSWFLCFCVDLILERSNWFCFIYVYIQDSLICVFNIQVLNTMSHKKKMIKYNRCRSFYDLSRLSNIGRANLCFTRYIK